MSGVILRHPPPCHWDYRCVLSSSVFYVAAGVQNQEHTLVRQAP